MTTVTLYSTRGDSVFRVGYMSELRSYNCRSDTSNLSVFRPRRSALDVLLNVTLSHNKLLLINDDKKEIVL